MSEIWPNIAQRSDPMPNAESAQDETGKFEVFLAQPRTGQLVMHAGG